VKLESSALIADQERLDALKPHSWGVICDDDCILFSQGDRPIGIYVFCFPEPRR
jgi:hypothetical protein